jgi:hypothetical protein
MEVRTNRCHEFGHPEFVWEVDERLIAQSDREWLVATTEQEIETGQRYQSGEMAQIGWMLTSVRQYDERSLTFWEPDFQGMPIEWIHSSTRTLLHLRVQKDVVRSFPRLGVPVFPSLRDAADVCTSFFDRASFFIERRNPEGNHSGWFMGCMDDSHDHEDPSALRLVSLYEVACQRPGIIPFLALPPGFNVSRHSQNVVPSCLYHGEAQTVVAASDVAKLLKEI